MNDRLGITEFRNIIAAIIKTYNIDFSDYALTSLKRRFEKVIALYNFKDLEDFIQKLEVDANFFESFLNDIAVEETEMFRDPPMWQDLKDTILSKFEGENEYKIWLPDSTSGDEMYSVLILLKELRLLDMTNVVVTCMSSKNIDQIKNGFIDIKKVETNTANYRRLRSDFQFSKYIDVEEKKAIIDPSLMRNVTFLKHDLFRDKAPANFRIVVFRNKMIYYNQHLQAKALEIIYNSLLPGGHFVIGINESIENYGYQDKLALVNPTENIFKKVLQ